MSTPPATPPSPEANPPKPREAAMPFIMVTMLIDMLAIGLIIPVLPAMVGGFTGSQADQAYWYGVVTFTFGLANFISSPILGALSDQHGRRPILLLGFLGLCISFYGTAMATAMGMLIAVRVLSGAMQANISICNAYVADFTPPEQRAKRFGMLGAMQGVGFIVGPVMGGLLGAVNLHLPFLVAGVLATINLVYGYFVLPESLPLDKRKPVRWATANPWSALKRLAALRGVGSLVGVVAFNGLAQYMLYTSWVLYTSFKFGWGPLENGWSLAAVGVVSVIMQGFVLGKLLKRYSPQALAIVGLVSSALSYLLWGLAWEGWMMFAVIGVNFLANTVNAAINSMISGAADAKNQGATLGAVSSLNSLMAVAAPLIAAPLLVLVSGLPKGDWRIGAPFYFCAVLQVGSLLLAIWHFRKFKRRSGLRSGQ